MFRILSLFIFYHIYRYGEGGTHSTSAQCSGEQIIRGNTERCDTRFTSASFPVLLLFSSSRERLGPGETPHRENSVQLYHYQRSISVQMVNAQGFFYLIMVISFFRRVYLKIIPILIASRGLDRAISIDCRK